MIKTIYSKWGAILSGTYVALSLLVLLVIPDCLVGDLICRYAENNLSDGLAVVVFPVLFLYTLLDDTKIIHAIINLLDDSTVKNYTRIVIFYLLYVLINAVILYFVGWLLEIVIRKFSRKK